jgi:hypothetical protein
MRIALVVVLLAATACAGPAAREDAPVATPRAAAAASCVGKQLHVRPVKVAPGAALLVVGSGLVPTCADMVVNGAFPETPQPLTGLTVLLVQGAEHWTLADGLGAQPDGTLDVTVTIPDDARIADGAAQIAVGGVGAPVVIARP